MNPGRTGAGGPRGGTLAFAFTSIALSVAAAAASAPLAERPAAFIGAYVLAGISWWWACSWAAQANLRAPPLFAGAVALRAVALAVDPHTSDDVYRYAWEAEVVLDGASPYAFAPGAPELAELRARFPDLAARVAHDRIPAAYPPLAQASFASCALVARPIAAAMHCEPWRATVAALRVVAALADVAVLAGVLAVLRARGLPSGRAVAWAWSPLAALELSGAGHFDGLAIAPWLAALAAVERRERGEHPYGSAASALLGAAAAVKCAPIASLPFAARGRGGARTAAVTLAVLALAVAPLALLRGGWRGLLEGLARYASTWESSGLAFGGAKRALEWLGVAHAGSVARALALALFVGVGAWLWRRRARTLDASRTLVAAALVLTPTLHPWYVVWMLPFLAVRPSHAWSALAALAPLAHVLAARWQTGAGWIAPAWLWPSLALPFAALLALEWRARRR